MSNGMMVFNSDEFGNVRVVEKGDDNWFVAKDICDCVGLEVRDSVRYLDDDEKCYVSREHIGLPPGKDIVLINESGLYSLILRSRKPEAKKFKKWVTSEVLPSIRKTGLFATLPVIQRGLVTHLGMDIWTTTDKIAEVFGRRHDNVITAFERGMEECAQISEEMSLENKGGLEFKMELTSYIDSKGRVQPCYRINRPLFNYVALNFTGNNANMYRFTFIQQFEAMDRYIRVQLAKQMLYTKDADQVVYVIKNEQTGLVKIGVAKDPLKRMQTLANQSGCKLQMVYCTPKCKNAYLIEQDLHKSLSENREVGEWFNIPECEVVDLLQSMALDFGSGFLGLEA